MAVGIVDAGFFITKFLFIEQRDLFESKRANDKVLSKLMNDKPQALNPTPMECS
jgi:hypothetical protein